MVGGILLSEVTLGFRAFTQETARRIQIREQPRAVPAVALQLQDGSIASSRDFAGRIVIATFIYTTCRSACPVIMATMQQMRAALRDSGQADAVHFVTISFDPETDTPARLAEFAGLFRAPLRDWWVARPVEDLDVLLDVFGVTVIPLGHGMYVHNAAFYLIDRQQRIVDVFDGNDTAGTLAALRARL